MSADISALGTLQPVEPLDLEAYQDNKESNFQLPPKGRYTVQAPDNFTSEAFGRAARSGALTARVDPTIVGPTNGGYTIRFTKVSAKQFKRNGVTVSQLGDYLRACGFKQRLNDEQAQADAVEATANRVYEIEGDWRAYCKHDGWAIEGMERFPSDGSGGHQSWITHPTLKTNEAGEVDLNGTEPLRVLANFVVTRYVPATA